MSYRLVDANELQIKYPEVNDMPCIYADLDNGLDGGHYTLSAESCDCINWFVNVKDIEKLPTVSFPEREKGEWISAKVGKLFPSNDYKCSICGNILNFDGVNCGRGDANYCPNCGARMKGGE